MTSTPGDLTRQWVNLLKRFPHEYRQDEEIVQWVADRWVGPLVALLDADRQEAREELRGLRRRFPKEFARAQRENRGEYEWDDYEDEDAEEELSDRQWEQRNRQRNRQEAEYEWVHDQYRTHVFVVQDRSRLIDRIRELEAFESQAMS